MASRKALTGGTDDVNPQYLSARFSQSGTDSTDVFQFATPIVRVGSNSNGRATIMEILKVFMVLPDAPQAGAVQTAAAALMSLMTSNTSTPSTVVQFGDSRVIANPRYTIGHAFNAGGSGLTASTTEPKVFDLTDGAGHGLLVAVDNLFVQVDTTGMAGARVFELKILYRFKTVSLTEYIGIVQSQQATS